MSMNNFTFSGRLGGDAEGREVRRSLGFQRPSDMLAWLKGI